MIFCFIYNYFFNLVNSLLVFKSVYVIDQKENKQLTIKDQTTIKNKTIIFYLSYLLNFKYFNYRYYKIRIEDKNGLYKIYTNTDFKSAYIDYKFLKPKLNNKKIISFKIDGIEYVGKLKPYIYFDNSIYDFYLFNKPKNHINNQNMNLALQYQTKQFNRVSNIQEVKDVYLMINQLLEI